MEVLQWKVIVNVEFLVNVVKGAIRLGRNSESSVTVVHGGFGVGRDFAC